MSNSSSGIGPLHIVFNFPLMPADGCLVLSEQAILMLGGHDGQQWTTMMHLFYPQLGAVHEFEHVPFTQGYGGSVLLSRNVYVIGGGDGANWNKTAYSFALDTKEWFQVSCKPAKGASTTLLFD